MLTSPVVFQQDYDKSSSWETIYLFYWVSDVLIDIPLCAIIQKLMTIPISTIWI